MSESLVRSCQVKSVKVSRLQKYLRCGQHTTDA
jgi:hypothetical protein